MKSLPPSPSTPLVQRHLRLGITLSARCTGHKVWHFEHRLRNYLCGSGLLIGMTATRVDVLADGHDIHPLERALLVAWLAQQPEVVVVRVERLSTPSNRGDRHGQA
jgi:hypothetical protein